jgi:fatty acid desaturase
MENELQNQAAASLHHKEFAEISRQVRDGNLLARRPGYYAIKIATTSCALVALIVAAIVVGNSWSNLGVAVGLAAVMAQLGFIGHDAGHRQICAHRRGNDLIGLVHANLLTGFSFGWWLSKHNRHHAHTNRPGKDPDITPGVLVYTPGQAEDRAWFGRSFARVQAFALVPLLFFEAFNLHAASIVSLVHRRGRGRLVEAGMLAVHGIIFFVAPFLILSPVRAVTFVAVTQLLLGLYLGATFVANHVGMPTLVGDDDLGFLRRQVLTSRNLSSPPVTGFIFGGLDTQIEHHLFPTMPRANLRRARELVRPFCAERQIAYVEQRPYCAYRDVFRSLRVAGAWSAIPAVN